MERIRGFSVTNSQVSLYLCVMDVNEERGRQKMDLSRRGVDLQIARKKTRLKLMLLPIL